MTDLLDPTNPNSGTDTNRQALVTLDVTPPISAVTGLAPVQTSNSFVVNWSGTDVGSGIDSFDIYVSTNGGPWSLWLARTNSTSAIFNGQVSNTYGFFSIARDLAGNKEALKSAPDTTTTVSPGTTPVFQTVVNTGGLVSLTWSSILGRNYQLQSSGDLSAGNWSNLGPSVTATNALTSASDSSSTSSQRFYRVILLP